MRELEDTPIVSREEIRMYNGILSVYGMEPGERVYAPRVMINGGSFTEASLRASFFESRPLWPVPVTYAMTREKIVMLVIDTLKLVYPDANEGDSDVSNEVADYYVEGWVLASSFLPTGKESRARMYIPRSSADINDTSRCGLSPSYFQLIPKRKSRSRTIKVEVYEEGYDPRYPWR